MPRDLTGQLDASDCRLGIVVARFNSEITDRLLAGALQAIGECGGDVDAVPVAHVPGSLELAVAARGMAESGAFDAVICLGCIIRGQTSHYDVVVDGTIRGITDAIAATGVPVIFGVLTTEDREQALARSDESMKRNTGAYAGRAAIQMADLMKQIAGFGGPAAEPES